MAGASGVSAQGTFPRTAQPGVLPLTEAKILDRLRAGVDRPPRGLTLNRARQLAEEIAAALGGEIAGDPRRWADTSFDLAVVVPSRSPATVISAFERLPQIVTLVERDERRATGVTVDGVPVVLHLPAPGRFGSELVRQTGSQS